MVAAGRPSDAMLVAGGMQPVAEALSSLGVPHSFEAFGDPLDSASMTPAHWRAIACRIEAVYDSHDGFVIIQGTDTLAYTASALSFMFAGLTKPIIVTGAQIPLGRAGSDALDNLRLSVRIASHRSCGLACIPEVVVAFGGRVFRGCRSRKISAVRPQAFGSPNCMPLATGGTRLAVHEKRVRPIVGDETFRLNAIADGGVADVALHPGLEARTLRAILESDRLEAMVLRTHGSGNAPDDKDLLGALRDAVRGGKTIAAVTHCVHGGVTFGRYRSSMGLADAGVLSAGDMTPEAAVAKLLVLKASKTADEMTRLFQEDLRGERSF